MRDVGRKCQHTLTVAFVAIAFVAVVFVAVAFVGAAEAAIKSFFIMC